MVRCTSVCVCSILVLVVFCQSGWLEQKGFSRIRVCDTAVLSHLAYLTPHSYVCELSVSALLWDPMVFVRYVTSASLLAARQSVRVCDCSR